MDRSAARNLALALISLTAAAPAAATIALGSSLALEASARVGERRAVDTDSAAQGATIAPLDVAVLAVAQDGASSVETGASALATWRSASAGRVLFDDVGWRAVDVADGAATPAGGAGWRYAFIADTDGVFEMDWSVEIGATTSDPFGLNFVVLEWSGDGGGSALAAGQAGTLIRAIEEGVAYTVGLTSQANIGGALRTRSALMDASFDWRMGPVGANLPEPGALALAGVAMLSLGLLRARAR